MHVVINHQNQSVTVCQDLTQIARLIGHHVATVKAHEPDSVWHKHTVKRSFTVHFHCHVMKSQRGGKNRSGFKK